MARSSPPGKRRLQSRKSRGLPRMVTIVATVPLVPFLQASLLCSPAPVSSDAGTMATKTFVVITGIRRLAAAPSAQAVTVHA